MNDKNKLIQAINRILPMMTVDTLEFVYFYLIECAPNTADAVHE